MTYVIPLMNIGDDRPQSVHINSSTKRTCETLHDHGEYHIH